MEELSIIEIIVLYIVFIGALFYGIYWVLGNLRKWVESLVRRFTKDHVVVIGLTPIGFRVAMEVLKKGKKIIVISTKTSDTLSDKIKKSGGYVINAESVDERVLRDASVHRAQKCLVATGTDVDNISLTNFIAKHITEKKTKNKLRILLHIADWDTKSLMLDYVSQYLTAKNVDVRIFDIDQEAARLVYDKFPPHRYVNDETIHNQKKSICVIGFNKVAEAFILENSILSHYPGTNKFCIYIIEKDAEVTVKSLIHNYPFLDKFLELVPVEMENSFFAGTENWHQGFVKNISSVDAAYCFGEDDAVIINTAVHFKQFLYNRTGNIRKVPLIACLPESTEVFSLMEQEEGVNKGGSILKVFRDDLVLHTVRKYSDTCDVTRLIFNTDSVEILAKAVNYFYSIKYEFNDILNTHFKKNANAQFLEQLQEKYLNFKIKKNSPLEQLNAMVVSSIAAYTKNSEYRVQQYFSIEDRWDALSERNKDSNRYVARDLDAKVYGMKLLGAKTITREQIELFAGKLSADVHKKWVAEKLSAHYAFGEYPRGDKNLKSLLKGVLKVHDMIVPYEALDASEKGKDKDLFYMIPLMLRIRENL